MARLEIITGPMYAKKTSRLIQEIEDSIVAGDTILVFRPVIDNREERNFFTRLKDNPGIANYDKIQCRDIKDPEEIYRLTGEYNPNIILIDEVQFLSQDTTLIIQKILDENCNKEGFMIVASGLETDFKRDLFGPTHALMAIADKITKLKAVCNRCKKKNAIFTWRKGGSALQVIVGGKGLYEARCRKCYLEREPSQ
jgi:thymidine kinase